jgi:hypothetical protein
MGTTRCETLSVGFVRPEIARPGDFASCAPARPGLWGGGDPAGAKVRGGRRGERSHEVERGGGGYERHERFDRRWNDGDDGDECAAQLEREPLEWRRERGQGYPRNEHERGSRGGGEVGVENKGYRSEHHDAA